jgi:hypothetical protein
MISWAFYNVDVTIQGELARGRPARESIRLTTIARATYAIIVDAFKSELSRYVLTEQ